MKAATIAAGLAYLRLAELAAESVHHYTGLEPLILAPPADWPHAPAAYKLRLLDLFPGETVFYFDADTRLVRPWQLADMLAEAADAERFYAVADKPSLERNADAARYSLDPTRYFNSGLFIAPPAAAAAFRAAETLYASPDYRTNFKYEQTALNWAIHAHGPPLELLPRRFNAITTPETPPPEDAVVLHIAGGTTQGENRRHFEAALRRLRQP